LIEGRVYSQQEIARIYAGFFVVIIFRQDKEEETYGVVNG